MSYEDEEIGAEVESAAARIKARARAVVDEVRRLRRRLEVAELDADVLAAALAKVMDEVEFEMGTGSRDAVREVLFSHEVAGLARLSQDERADRLSGMQGDAGRP